MTPKTPWLISAAAALLLATPQAQADGFVVEVAPADGSQALTMPLEALAKITFASPTPESLTLTPVKGTPTTLALDKVGRITFKLDDTTGITTQTAAQADATVSREGNVLRIMPATPDTPLAISLYGADGRLLHALTATGTATIDLGTLPEGVYVLKAGATSHKFAK